MKKDVEEKARKAFRESLTRAQAELRAFLADGAFAEELPRRMRDDALDVLEEIEAVLEYETAEERDEACDQAIDKIGE